MMLENPDIDPGTSHMQFKAGALPFELIPQNAPHFKNLRA